MPDILFDRENYNAVQYTVLGTLMQYPDKVGEAITRLQPEYFDVVCRAVYEAIRKLFLAGAPTDALAVRQEAGEAYSDTIDEALKYHAADVLYYCDTLAMLTKLSQIRTEAGNLSVCTAMEDAAGHMEVLNGLMVNRRATERLSAMDAAKDFFAVQDGTQPTYLKFGIAELDDNIFAEPGDFILIGGYPRAGKTLLSLQMAQQMAEDGHHIGYYSLETGPKKLRDRMISHMALVPLKSIKKHMLTKDEWARAGKACEKLSKLELDFVRASGWTVGDIQADALCHRYDIIFVDYLGIVEAKGDKRYEVVTNISMGLHTMAQSNGITVIALQQLSRPDKEKGKPKPPSLSDFRESGQIEQDADVAMLLYPSDPHDNRSSRILTVAKNKDGEQLRMELEFRGDVQTLIPPDTGKAIMRELCDDGRRIKEANHREALAEQKSLEPDMRETDDREELPF